jgi:hypothetical protein
LPYGQEFCVRAGGAVDRAEFTDAVGGAERRHAVDARVAVSRIRSVELVATADPSHVLVCAHRVLDRERIVARDAENVLDTQLFQARKNVLNNRLAHDFSPLQKEV